MKNPWSTKQRLVAVALLMFAMMIVPELPGLLRTGQLPPHLLASLPMFLAVIAGASTLVLLLDARKAATPPERRRSRRRAFRRWMVVAMSSGHLAASAWILAFPEGPATFFAFLLVLFTTVGGMRWLNSATFAGVPESGADERQRASRDRAHRVAYNIVSAYALALVFLIAFGGRLGLKLRLPNSPPLSGYFDIAWIYIMVMPLFTLPAAVLAWTEPDDPAPDAA